MKRSAFLILILLLLPGSALPEISAPAPSAAPALIEYQEPEFLTFQELLSLSDDPEPAGPLKKKLRQLFTTPIIDNRAFFQGASPINPVDPRIGKSIRVATWNIEKSLRIDEAIKLLTVTDEEFRALVNVETAPSDSALYETVTRQRNRLKKVDILVLQEMEIGIKRSRYRNAAADLAQTLNMNYAYGTQYLEVDPVILGREDILFEDGQVDREMEDFYRVDPDRFKGVFGSAVLSRYPIAHVELHPLKTQPYDWYREEEKKATFMEHLRRFGSKAAFKNELTREMKVGGRPYFRVDLAVPEMPGGILTIINVHLEIKCQPKDRDLQMQEILKTIKPLKQPLIMLGDFNAAPTDISPTSAARIVKRTAKNPTTWFSAAVNYISPHGLALNTTRTISNFSKNFNDPFATDVKVIAPNPLKPMFERIRDFRFEDYKTFDFRGNPNRSTDNKDGLLANSNQRGTKGFVTTFRVRRPWGIIGKFRLDWIFVKGDQLSPLDAAAPYRFAPHFGETMEELNTSLIQPVSDHHPSVVDLPFKEPLF